MILFKNAASGLPVPYGNYGNLMRIILYHCTKDVVWIKTLPESQPALGIQSMRDRMIDEANLDFEQSQTYLDRASSIERLKSELPMTQSTPIQALSLPTTANTTIRTALPKFMKHLKIFMVTVILLIVLLKLMESMKKISFKGCKDKSFFIDKLGRQPRHHILCIKHFSFGSIHIGR